MSTPSMFVAPEDSLATVGQACQLLWWLLCCWLVFVTVVLWSSSIIYQANRQAPPPSASMLEYLDVWLAPFFASLALLAACHTLKKVYPDREALLMPTSTAMGQGFLTNMLQCSQYMEFLLHCCCGVIVVTWVIYCDIRYRAYHRNRSSTHSGRLHLSWINLQRL
jgi:hypothetical protein